MASKYKSNDFLRSPRPKFASLKLRKSEEGSEEPSRQRRGARQSQNQFTPPGDGVNKLIFKRFRMVNWLWFRLQFFFVSSTGNLYRRNEQE